MRFPSLDFSLQTSTRYGWGAGREREREGRKSDHPPPESPFSLPSRPIGRAVGWRAKGKGGGKMLEGIITLDVLFPPVPLKRDIVKAWAKDTVEDRIIKVYYNDDWNRYGVLVQSWTGTPFYIVFDRSRIYSFNVKEVQKRHRSAVLDQLIKFYIPDEVVKACYEVNGWKREVLPTYAPMNYYRELEIHEREDVIKRLTNATSVRPYPICAGHNERFNTYRLAEETAKAKEPSREGAYLFETVYASPNQRHKAFPKVYVVASRNILTNWYWWERSDLASFFI